ncbi:MAG: hypothetical protein JW871_05655 [Endomicrobiales bacterium]|nr:hypothetical protein [Endomicrobiales bacterium]
MVLRIGHRGACFYEPENTLISFKKAIELGCGMIEFDVHLCASGELVVIHDGTLRRTTNGKGVVAKKTLAQLKTLDAGKGEEIPTLKETINFINKRAVSNIELKGRHTAIPAVQTIKRYVKAFGWKYHSFLVSSFSVKTLKVVRVLDPKVPIGLLIYKINDNVFRIAKKLKAYSIHPKNTCVTKSFIQEAHKQGYKVFVWPVENQKEINKLVTWGADGIFSATPDKVPKRKNPEFK